MATANKSKHKLQLGDNAFRMGISIFVCNRCLFNQFSLLMNFTGNCENDHSISAISTQITCIVANLLQWIDSLQQTFFRKSLCKVWTRILWSRKSTDSLFARHRSKSKTGQKL